MKILTKEEEQEHYNATIQGGFLGGIGGLALGGLGVFGAARRYPAFKGLGLPLQAFLVCSSGTFAGIDSNHNGDRVADGEIAIISADRYSRFYERQRDPSRQYEDSARTAREQIDAQKTTSQKALSWLNDNRYSIVFGSWFVGIGAAWAVVNRDKYLTLSQKIVQTRVWAQGITVLVMIASLAFETSDSARGKGRWETVKYVDPNDPEHKRLVEKKVHHERYAGEDQWRDMVEAEEQRLAERKKWVQQREESDKKNGKGKKSEKDDGEKETKDKKASDNDGSKSKSDNDKDTKDKKSEESESKGKK